MHRRSLAGSLIGSIKETQDVLDFCAEHNVAPDVQVIDIQDVNDAYCLVSLLLNAYDMSVPGREEGLPDDGKGATA